MKNNLECKTIQVNENTENFREVFEELKVGDKIKWNRGEDKYKGLVTKKSPNYLWAVTRGYSKEQPSHYLMGGVGKFKPLYGSYIAEHGFELKEDMIRYWGNNGDLCFKKSFKGFEEKSAKYTELNELMKQYKM